MKIVRPFLYLASIVLLLAAAAKLVSSAGSARILHEHDPMTNLEFATLFRIVGVIELAVALACIFCRRLWFSVGLLAWLATCFLGYRIALILLHYNRPCSCMGNLTDALHISPQTADTAMKIILAYLLIGSYATLFWLWRQRRLAPSMPK